VTIATKFNDSKAPRETVTVAIKKMIITTECSGKNVKAAIPSTGGRSSRLIIINTRSIPSEVDMPLQNVRAAIRDPWQRPRHQRRAMPVTAGMISTRESLGKNAIPATQQRIGSTKSLTMHGILNSRYVGNIGKRTAKNAIPAIFTNRHFKAHAWPATKKTTNIRDVLARNAKHAILKNHGRLSYSSMIEIPSIPC